MAEIIANSFTSYKLTEKEALQGAIFTSLQLQSLQNLLTVNAEEKLAIEYDPEKHLDFVQQEAYKRGQIELLAFLIDNSAIAADELNNPESQT